MRSPEKLSMSAFSSFPAELHEQILTFMDPEDIIALRKTSKHFFALTQDPRLWSTIHTRIHQTHPLGCSHSEFAALARRPSERVLVQASKTQKMFQTVREQAQHRITPIGEAQTGRLVALSFLSERFLLSVKDTSVVYVWDLSKLGSSAGTSSFPCARLTLVGWNFLVHGMSSDGSTLYVVLSHTGADTSVVHVFSLSLPSTSTSDTDELRLSFRDIAYFDTYLNVCHIDPDSCLMLLRMSHTIEILNWRTKNRSGIALQNLAGTPPDINYVLAMCICGPYVLCIRRFSVDAYSIPPGFAQSMEGPPSVRLVSISVTGGFKRATLSRVRCIRSPGQGEVGDVIAYSVCALLHGTREGTCCYQVGLKRKPSSPWMLFAQRLAERPGEMSTWDIGASGLRGVWSYRPPNTNERHVVAFTLPSCPSQAVLDSIATEDGVWPEHLSMGFEERVVWVVWPWDLADEVTSCAVSEYTGRIALGMPKKVINVI